MNFKSYLIEFSNYWKGNGSVSFIWPFPLNFARNESKSLHNVLKEKNHRYPQSWPLRRICLWCRVEIFCTELSKYFAQVWNFLCRVEIFCDVWKYFVQCVNILHKCGNIQSGKVQIYAATEFFKFAANWLLICKWRPAPIHLLSPSFNHIEIQIQI